MERLAIVYITDKGRQLAERLRSFLNDAEIVRFTTAAIADVWNRFDAFVFIMASGIVVRTIAPLLKDKMSDPAVVVVDDTGRFAVSLVGGHIRGANELSKRVARYLGGEAVITTASDVNGLTPLDLWAVKHDLAIEDRRLLPEIGTRLVNNGALRVYVDEDATGGMELPDEYLRVSEPAYADVIISDRKDVYIDTPSHVQNEACQASGCRVKGQIYLRPKNIVIGIGCNRGTSSEEIEAVVSSTLDSLNISLLSVSLIATLDIKADEPGLKSFIERHGIDLVTFTPSELNTVSGVEESEAALRATGARAVSEPAALLASGNEKLLMPKQKIGNVTVAVAKKRIERHTDSKKTGRLFIVGTGPGSQRHITPAAMDAISVSDVIVGYTTYLELIDGLVRDKEVISTGMTQEVERCRLAIELAAKGKTVSVISGGDPGVYAMAGLVLELLKRNEKHGARPMNSDTWPGLRVEVIPGVSALNAAAARLGAPLMHDFASISLSDRLTPWDVIEKRLDAAAASDFVIVLYNPRSKGRPGHLSRAREIILRHRRPDTVVGIVRAAMRPSERVIITDIANMKDEDVDMQTTVIIGNSKTTVWGSWMITPRGYEGRF